MELTKQVPKQELCKRMEELGWGAETIFWWYGSETTDFRLNYGKDDFHAYTPEHLKYPAPTVAELGEAISRDGFIDYLTHNEFPITTALAYKLLTDPNACAKMWIYLKENKLI